MIDKIQMHYYIDGCEGCVATLEVHTANGTITRTMDFSGNAISAALFGAVSVVNTLQEIMGHEPEGHVQRQKPRKARLAQA